jgi:hypothetical protein
MLCIKQNSNKEMSLAYRKTFHKLDKGTIELLDAFGKIAAPQIRSL